MKYPRSRFYKGIPGFSFTDDDGLLEAAEASVYKRWWQLMRLSPVFWYARTTGIAPVDSVIAENYEKAGNLKFNDFSQWWEKHGKYVFEETSRPAHLRIVNIADPNDRVLDRKSLLIEVPLTSTRKRIISDLKRILDSVDHDVTGRNVIKLSNAPLKLKSKKFNITTLENESWVLIYRILYPHISVWKIGDRLQLAPHLDVRELDQKVFSKGEGPFATLQSLTGRNLYKARFARYHVERGSFPDYTRVYDFNDVKPFGEKHHHEFLEATNESGLVEDDLSDPVSPWQKHIQREYAQDLKYKIIHANRHDQRYVGEAKFKLRYDAFIAGETNLI
jgi:hypothetical protein